MNNLRALLTMMRNSFLNAAAFRAAWQLPWWLVIAITAALLGLAYFAGIKP